MDKQWVVFSREEGLIGIFDNYDEALKEYQESKDAYENFVYENGEHDPNEDIILATIDKRFYSYDTKKPTEDDDTSTYWDFKEDSFNPDPIPPTIKPGDKVDSAIGRLKFSVDVMKMSIRASHQVLNDPESTDEDKDGLPEAISEAEEELKQLEKAISILEVSHD